MTAEQTLSGLYQNIFDVAPEVVTQLPGAGSSRTYFRLSGHASDGKALSVIGTAGSVERENRAFISLSAHLSANGVMVPKVFAVSDNGLCYLQDDLGNLSLYDALADARAKEAADGNGFTGQSMAMLQATMELMALTNMSCGNGAPWEDCFPQQAMDSRMVRWDLNYFKYCFLKTLGIEIPEPELENEFDNLHDRLMQRAATANEFIARDFQSRNVMWHNGHPWLIDFQGGRRGPAEYDVASFLWQAKAAYPDTVRTSLVESYINNATRLNRSFNAMEFRKSLPYFVLFRMMQTLGAYGLRGLSERKPHFMTSIPSALRNITEHLSGTGLQDAFPVLTEILYKACDAPVVSEIEAMAQAGSSSALTVTITSFSYKRGIPVDLSGNGGGFVFDCRAIHNPGRYEQYKHLTGRDEPVRRFLEKDGEIITFLGHACAIVDASVEKYIQRGFKSLCVSFGCTGGQHRSVYSAEAMATHIAQRFPAVKTVLFHREQKIIEIKDPTP